MSEEREPWPHDHGEALRLAYSKPVTGKVIAARLAVNNCGECQRRLNDFLEAIDDIDSPEPEQTSE